MNAYDVIVIGGGHAGAEAAWAAAHLGAKTALLTMQPGAIGRMSCNPAIGGLGKGQIVREIDALGGLMGLAIDAAGIQFRMLNKSKGPAVWAPRAQADRELYAAHVQQLLTATPRLDIVQGIAQNLLTEPATGNHAVHRRVTGLVLDGGRRLNAPRVIIATGTFMRALMHCGTQMTPGGRAGEGTSPISAALEELGFEIRRLKTGTPPRVHRDSVNYDLLQPQSGDNPPTPFSFITTTVDRPQIRCWITHTNHRTHTIIRDHLHLAPMYTGQIQSPGPRYCPSIEDKVVRFADKSRHQIFLEPEGRDNERVYCNGISTSLPADVQTKLLATIPGLENARIIQPGYAVEYDCVPTHQITSSLETKPVAGLFLAGQVNGTSGYEEAAAQGLVAGINTVRSLNQQQPMILRRDQAYIGVMIDDLVTKPLAEPYRMFTSRAEYRLHLRADNADQRLTPLGRRIGLVDDQRWTIFDAKMKQIDRIKDLLAGRRHEGKLVSEWLRRTDVTLRQFRDWLSDHGNNDLAPVATEQVYIDARYAGYIARQQRHIDRFGRMESIAIPPNVDFGRIPQLRLEARERLAKIRPTTLGQAARISGINPADITVLWVLLTRKNTPKNPHKHSKTGDSPKPTNL